MKYLSKLMSMLLIGAMLWTVGCTDYDEDIRDLNNKIDDIQQSLMNDHITPLKTDLEKAKADLTKMVNDAKAELTAAHAADVAALQAKDTELDGKISKANEAISAANARIDGLVTELNKVKSDLEKAIADGDAATLKAAQEDAAAKVAALKAELQGEINDLTGEMNKAITAVNSEIGTIKTDVAALKLQDEEFKNQLDAIRKSIEALQEDLNKKYEELNKTIDVLDQKLQRQIDQNKTDIASLRADLTLVQSDLAAAQSSIADLQKDMVAHVEAFTKYQIEVDTKINDLTKRIETAEATLKDIVENVIPALEKQIAANEELSKKNAAEIAENEALFAVYKQEVANTLNALAAADEANAKLINTLFAGLEAVEQDVLNLEGALNDYKSFIEGELNDCWAGINNVKAMAQANANTISQVAAALSQQISALSARAAAVDSNIAALQAEDTAIWNYVKSNFGVLQASIEQNYDELSGKIEDVQAELTAYKAEVTKEINTAVEAAKDEFRAADQTIMKVINLNTTDLQNKINALNTKIDGVASDLAAYKTEVNGKLTTIGQDIKDLQDELKALKGRIQSLVFVPEYEDGKATIEYAKFGTNNIDAQSVLLYQVYPANCAIAIEASDLEFVFSDALKTRAANPALKVVAVEEYTTKPGSGIIAVTVKAHDLQEVYATDNAKYAVSLVFKGKSNGADTNIASSYTVLHREKDTEVSNITWNLNSGYNTAAEIEYIATNSVEVLGGINVEFEVDGVAKTIAEIEAEYGLKVAPKHSYAPTYSADTYVSALDGETKNSKDAFKNVVREDNGYDVSIALATPDKATVGLVQSIEYGFTLSNHNGAVVDELKDVATVEVTKIKGYMTLDPQTITWARSKDNEADLITPKAPTSRLVATAAGKLVNINGEELATAGTTYADIISGVAAITVDGVDLASTSYNVVFGKDANDAPTVLFEGFEWNKEYDIVAAYEIDNIIAEISIKLTTVQNSSVVTLDPSTITWNYAADKASELGADTFRAVAANADNATLYADVIANGALVSITPATGFVFTADGFEATAFAWNSNYDVEALYAVEDQLVTVKVAVETVKDTFADLTIDLAAEDWKYNAAFASTGVFETANEALSVVHSQLTNLGDITAADYLTDIFVTYAPTMTATANNFALANTKLVVAADGQNINAVYDINDFTAAPAEVEYVLTVETWYGQKITFKKTLNIGLEKVTLKLAEETKDIAKNLVFTTDAESLAALHAHADVQRYLDGSYVADADAFLTEVLVSKTTNLFAVNANTVNGVAMANSLFTHNGVKGQVSYDYNDFTATPDVLSYVYNVTTWYGQEFEITKVVNIKKDIRTYDFYHVNTWVYEAPYYSQITPEYTYLNESLMNATAFSLSNMKLNDAFLVKDGAMNTLDDAALAALGLSIEFKTKNPAFSSMITAPTATEPYWSFAYATKEASVGLTGHIYLETGIAGEVIELPTQFTEPDGLYKDYYINGYQPIAETMKVNDKDAGGNDLKITKLVEAKEYKTSVWSLLSIKDKRGFELFGYDVTDNYGWVAGNDNNGFAATKNPSMAALYDATMTFSIVSIENLPAEQTGKVNITSGSGILTFDYTNKFMATKPIKVTVKASLTYRYGTVKDETLTYTYMTE